MEEGSIVDNHSDSQGGPSMIIAESAINLSSQRLYSEEFQKKETLTYWNTGNGQPIQPDEADNIEKSTPNMIINDNSVKVSLSSRSMEMSAIDKIDNAEQEEIITDLNMRILKDMIERITGKKIRFFQHLNDENISPTETDTKLANGEQVQQESSGFGMEYEYQESYFESESTSFSASGTILTSDGAEIKFDMDLNMSRQFYEEHNVNIRAGEALKDPLVINFSGTAAQLTQTEFSFDIDANGTTEQISFVTPDSGFLVLDKNGDGVVNDGTELFGASTGNGFKELGVYDDDKNDWIDENDSIYNDLQIWVKNHDGDDQLFALGKKGIGAIYLGNITTSFDIKNEDNEMLGKIRSSGIFLTEDYGVGSLQQIDLVV